ncbi:MAG: hypothetical protein ACPG8W_10750 [Candidatus Promineifilaceae bacterium]
MRRSLILCLFVFLVACSGSDPVAAPTDSTDPTTDVSTEASPTEASSTDIPPTETPLPSPTETPVLPTETPEPVSTLLEGGQLFDGEELGILITYPETWISQSLFGLFTLFASDEQVIEGDAFGEGAAAVLIAAPSDETSLEEMFEQEADIPENAEMLVEPEQITIAGREGLHATALIAEADEELYADIYAVEGDGATYLLTFVTQPDTVETYQPIFAAMVDSIEIGTADLSAIGDLMTETPLGNSAEAIDAGPLAIETLTQVNVGAPLAYTVDVEAGQSYLFVTAGGNDLILRLSDADGKELASADNEIEERPEVILYTAETDATLMLTVSAFLSSGEALVAFYPVADQSTESLSIDVAEGAIPLVVAQPLDELDAVLMIGEEEIDSNAAGAIEIALMSEYAEGNYEATVEAYSDSAGSYTLAVAYVDAGITEARRLVATMPETLQAIELDTVTEMVLRDVGYTISVPDEASYVIMATVPDIDLQLMLFDGENRPYREVDLVSDGKTELLILSAAAGEYTLLPSTYFSEAGTGTLSMQALQVDADQPDTVAMTLTDEGVRPLLIANPAADGDTQITITNADGDEIATIDDRSTGPELFDTINLPAGEYSATASYYADNGELDSPILGLADPNESYLRDSTLPAETQALSSGDAIDNITDELRYTLTVAEGVPMMLFAKSEADLVLSVYDSNNVLVNRFDRAGSEAAETVQFLEAGEFSVVASTFLGESADFTLSLVDMKVAEADTFDFSVETDMVTLIFAIPSQTVETDVILAIYDADGNELDSYDWSGTGSIEEFSSADAGLEAGDYRAEGSVFGDAEGAFTLAYIQLSAELLGE